MNQTDVFDQPQWYAIHTKPKQEDRADSNLRAWRVETFTPKIRERRVNAYTNKGSFVTKLLFSRYIFARFKASDLLHKVCFTRGVQSVVCFGGVPCPVDDKIIEHIRARLDSEGFVRMNDEIQPGDKVIINDGYFKDFKGIFEGKVKDQDRVTILLTTLNYQGHVSIGRDLVKKAS